MRLASQDVAMLADGQFVDTKLVRRLERVHDSFSVAWLEGHVDGPAGVRLERFGPVTAAVTPSRPDLDFMNRIHGLPESPDVLDEVLALYREHGLRPWVELPPGSDEIASRLADEGARPLDAVTVLYGVPTAAEPAAEVELRRVGPDEARQFGRVHLEGHGVPAGIIEVDASSFAASVGREDMIQYLARVDGEDAGAGVLFFLDGDASLANASTIERFRRRGVQTALLAQRLADAAEAGAGLITSLTTFGSDSQRNLVRAGLQVAYTKTVWRL
jgi:hypothetical protein